MTWTAPSIQRRDFPTAAGEREMLQGRLDFPRLTLLGLVRDLTDVERSWFRRRFLGEQIPDVHITEENPDADFDDADPAAAQADLAAFRAETEACDKAVADRGLDETFTSSRGARLNLRWVYVHLIEEYARHNGHADLLRERFDGVTGD